MRQSRQRHFSAMPARGFVLVPVVMAIAVIAAIAYLVSRQAGSGMSIATAETSIVELNALVDAGMSHALWAAQNNASCGTHSDIPVTAFANGTYEAAYSPSSGSPIKISTTANLLTGASRTKTLDNVRSYSAPADIKTQPGPADGQDTRILNALKSTTNYGAAAGLWVTNSGTDIQNGLIRFDLSWLPKSARISSARLAFYVSGTDAGTNIVASVYRVTRGWTEGTGLNSGIDPGDGATFDSFDGVSAWTNPGGDYDPVAIDSVAIVDLLAGAYEWDVTALVDAWVGGSYPNYGVLIGASTGTLKLHIDSSDSLSPELRPALLIAYQCECGVACSVAVPVEPPPPVTCDADFVPNLKTGTFDAALFSSGVTKDIAYLHAGLNYQGISIPSGGAWLVADGVEQKIYLVDTAGSLLFSTAVPTTITGIDYVASGAHAGHTVEIDAAGMAAVFRNLEGVASGSFSLAAIGMTSPSGIAFVGTTLGGTYDNHLAITDQANHVLYIIDQLGNLKLSLNLSGFGSGVTDVVHIPNTDKVILIDESGIAFTADVNGTITNQYSLSAFFSTAPSGLAINPTSCDHVVADEASFEVMSLNRTVNGTPPTSCAATYADDFETENYEGHTGTLAWLDDWIEIKENDGSANGDIRVIYLKKGKTNTLTLQDGADDKGAQRRFSSNSFTLGWLNLDIQRKDAFGASDLVRIEISSNDGLDWYELDRIIGTSTDSGLVPVGYDISPYLSPTMMIRIVAGPNYSSNAVFFFDNVEVCFN